jgi:hypothetical protein
VETSKTFCRTYKPFATRNLFFEQESLRKVRLLTFKNGKRVQICPVCVNAIGKKHGTVSSKIRQPRTKWRKSPDTYLFLISNTALPGCSSNQTRLHTIKIQKHTVGKTRTIKKILFSSAST